MKKFNTSLASDLGLEGQGMVSILVKFVIDEQGNISNTQATGGPEKLNEHARQVALALPHFQPAVQEGKPVQVEMEMPIKFRLFDK